MIKLFIIFWTIMLTSTEDTSFEKSLVRLIQDAGRKVEVHKVQTEDNYILTVFRLPSKLRNPKIVFIMHGLESSAADYVIGGNGSSLAYLLADNGYDVWLGNSRGNVFSQTHKTLTTESHEFWKFSFHEIGVYDLPAIINYALDTSNTTSLTYCGYSQGTTAFFVLLSMRPEYNSKISTAHLMAPVAFMRFPPRIIKFLASNMNQLVDSAHATRMYELPPINPEIRRMMASYCDTKMVGRLGRTCKENYMMAGHTDSQYNEDLMPKIFQFFPASAGYRQFMHYGQIINTDGRFVRFDHQKQKNLQLYGQPVPPSYNLNKVQSKIHFLYGANDVIANPKDVQHLMAKFKASTIGITKLNDWNHFDFMFGNDVQKKLNNVILQKIKSRE